MQAINLKSDSLFSFSLGQAISKSTIGQVEIIKIHIIVRYYTVIFLFLLFYLCIVDPTSMCVYIYIYQSFKRRKRKAKRFCVCEARRKPQGVSFFSITIYN